MSETKSAAIVPLQKQIRVRCPVDHAFMVFTEQIDLWWPLSHRKLERSIVSLETHVGGRFFERAPDGSEAVLGRVLVSEPPMRIIYSWVPGSRTGPTHVEVRFVAEGGATLVDVTHSPGDGGDVFFERVALFERAWSHVLEAFSTSAEQAR